MSASSERRFGPGEILWSEGDVSFGITLVLEGRVRIVRGSGGRQTVIHSGGPGSTLGEIPFFTGSTYPATAIAAEPTRCLILSHVAVERALSVDSRLAFFFLERLAGRVQSLVERIDQLAAHSVQARVARFFLERAESVGRARRDATTDRASLIFSLGMTQLALAEELGTVREVIVRALRELRQLGAIVALGDGKYRIGDEDVLKRLADLPSGGT